MGIPWTLRPCPVVHRAQACTRACTGHAPERRGCQPPAPTHSPATALRIKGEERGSRHVFLVASSRSHAVSPCHARSCSVRQRAVRRRPSQRPPAMSPPRPSPKTRSWWSSPVHPGDELTEFWISPPASAPGDYIASSLFFPGRFS
jgi:hypothetical protein